MLKFTLSILVPIALIGCASYPVSGTIGSQNERFVGTAHSVAVGMSEVKLITENGTNCIGEYKA